MRDIVDVTTHSDRLDWRVHQFLNRTVAFAALLTADGRILDVSENALMAGGLDLSAIRGTPFSDLPFFTHDGAVVGRMREAADRAAAGETVRFDYLAQIVDGSFLTVDFQMAPIVDEMGRTVELIATGFDVSDREETKRRLELALRESNHRIQNVFATIRAMARMTAARSLPETAMEDFTARLDAAAASHRALVEEASGHGASFDAICRRVLGPFLEGQEARITFAGPADLIAEEAARLIGLCLHELATNAAKYGALSDAGGTIEIRLDAAGPSREARFAWTERRADGGGVPQQADRRGYGMTFVRVSLAQIFGAEPEVEMTPHGITVAATGQAPHLFLGTTAD